MQLETYKTTWKYYSFRNEKHPLQNVERFYIYKEASINNHFNDTHTIPNSKILETILKGFKEESR